MTKQKLFSFPSLLTTLKAIVSNIATAITIIPLWLLIAFLLGKEMLALAILVGIFTGVWYLFFWGWISNKAWNWK